MAETERRRQRCSQTAQRQQRRLGAKTFASLRQRIRISYHMPAMALEETCRYIDHHTVRCGRPASIFADDAKADIHRHAGGVPRLVNAVCYRSILHAVVNDISIIDSTNIVTDELDS